MLLECNKYGCHSSGCKDCRITVPCYFCKKPTGEEYFCFGCKATVCGDCDDEEKWPPEGHKRPEDHYCKSVQHKDKPKKGPKKMGKCKESEIIRQLQTQVSCLQSELHQVRNNKDYFEGLWRSATTAKNQLVELHAQEIKRLRAKHAEDTSELVKTTVKEAEILVASVERDTLWKVLTHTLDKKGGCNV